MRQIAAKKPTARILAIDWSAVLRSHAYASAARHTTHVLKHMQNKIK